MATFAQKELQKYIESFDAADKDKNGKLSLTEVVAVLTTGGSNLSTEDAKKLFFAADKNMDFYISKDEFSGIVEKMPSSTLTENSLRRMFKSLDKDNSGYITKREIIDATANEDVTSQLDSGKVLELIKGVSNDADGKVYYEEFLNILGMDAASEALKAIFNKLDRDGGGTVTKEEMLEAVCKDVSLIKHLVTIQQLVLEVAKDDDQQLTYEEFLAAWKKHSAKK